MNKSGIHIKKANRGKFTSWAKSHGMGVQQAASHVMANKDKYSSTVVKRANFAKNAAKWHHADGGYIRGYATGGRVEKASLSDTDPNKSNPDIAYVVRTQGGDYPVFYKGTESAKKWHAEYTEQAAKGAPVYKSGVTGLTYRTTNVPVGGGGVPQTTDVEQSSVQWSDAAKEAGHRAAEKARAEYAEKLKNKPTYYLNSIGYSRPGESDQQTYSNYDKYDEMLLGLASGATAGRFVQKILPTSKGETKIGKLIAKASPVAGKIMKYGMKIPAAGLVGTGIARAVAEGLDPNKDIDYSKLGRNLIVGASLGLLSDPNAAAARLGRAMRIAKTTGKPLKEAVQEVEAAEAAEASSGKLPTPQGGNLEVPENLEVAKPKLSPSGAWRRKVEPSYTNRPAFGGNTNRIQGGEHLRYGGGIHKKRGLIRTGQIRTNF